MAYNDSGREPRRRTYHRRKVCRFCVNKEIVIDYKDVKLLSHFTSERGRIVPRRISGNCAKHQRELTRSIKRSRNIALMPFTQRQ